MSERHKDFREVFNKFVATYFELAEEIIPTRRERNQMEELILRSRRLIEIEHYQDANKMLERMSKFLKKMIERREVR